MLGSGREESALAPVTSRRSQHEPAQVTPRLTLDAVDPAHPHDPPPVMSRLRYLWVLPIAILTASGVGKLVGAAPLVESFRSFGAEPLMRPIGLIELACVAVFLVPRTRSIGFFLLCSYVGGIVATEWIHGRVPVPGLAVGALLWAGMYLERPSLFGPRAAAQGPEAVPAE